MSEADSSSLSETSDDVSVEEEEADIAQVLRRLP